jgi:hypothetical protein
VIGGIPPLRLPTVAVAPTFTAREGRNVLHLACKIRGATIYATDGEIGTVEDFFFEEARWTVRYILVDTGRWFTGKRVLISPMSVTGPWTRAAVNVALTKNQVWNSPQVDNHAMSRASEAEVLKHYGYPIYWGAAGVWGAFENPAALVAQPVTPPPPQGPVVDLEAQHLRSTTWSTGYHVHATDGEIGHVDDFLIGEESWRIRYLLVDTSNWIGGKSVVVLTDAVKQIEKDRGTLHVDATATRDEIKTSRPFESIEAAVGPAETGPPFVII